jgi:hypothetical protein
MMISVVLATAGMVPVSQFPVLFHCLFPPKPVQVKVAAVA